MNPNEASNDPSSYFLTEKKEEQVSLSQRLEPLFHNIQHFAIQIWPYVQKTINAVLYFIIDLVKAIIKIAIDQIKNFRA